MPYIKRDKKLELDPAIYELQRKFTSSPGDLVYTITRLLIHWVGVKSFAALCMGMGILVCTMFEFYRRSVAPYEDDKIKENGDVY